MILAGNDRRAEAIELMAWMVNALNPNDNQGLRDKLLHLYLRERRIEDALKLAARYPDDFSATCYGHVLALFMS